LRLRRHLSAEIYRELQLCDAPHVFNGLFAMTIASRLAALTETSERCA
jgi:hypothetical protein